MTDLPVLDENDLSELNELRANIRELLKNGDFQFTSQRAADLVNKYIENRNVDELVADLDGLDPTE